MEINQTAPSSPEVEIPYFGGCPECGGTNGFRNVGGNHWFYCDAHRTRWCAGYNLFSAWRDEDELIWRENAEYLDPYRDVKAVYGPNPNETLAQTRTGMLQTTKGELLERGAARPVSYFTQFVTYDDILETSHVAELAYGFDVRIQIARGLKKEAALQLIDKLKKAIEQESENYLDFDVISKETHTDDVPF